MSKLAIANPVVIEGRSMSPARRARIIERDKGRCVRAGCETPADRLQVDHIVCLALGGSDKDWNLETLCFGHHLTKTKADVAAIAKAKRRQLSHIGEKPPPTQKIRGRNTFKRRWGDG